MQEVIMLPERSQKIYSVAHNLSEQDILACCVEMMITMMNAI
jgi:hypothetical protein